MHLSEKKGKYCQRHVALIVNSLTCVRHTRLGLRMDDDLTGFLMHLQMELIRNMYA